MKNIVIVLFLALVTVGCANAMYLHPNYTEQKWGADYSSCSAMGGQASNVNDKYGIVRDRTIHNCLIGKGWTKQK